MLSIKFIVSLSMQLLHEPLHFRLMPQSLLALSRLIFTIKVIHVFPFFFDYSLYCISPYRRREKIAAVNSYFLSSSIPIDQSGIRVIYNNHRQTTYNDIMPG